MSHSLESLLDLCVFQLGFGAQYYRTVQKSLVQESRADTVGCDYPSFTSTTLSLCPTSLYF